jgi:hypothetical protein
MKRFDLLFNFTWIFILLIVLVGVGTSIYLTLTVNYVNEVKVTGKERIVESSGDNVDSYYLIFTNKETFKNEDSFIHGKFNSSDFQAKMEMDSVYNIKVSGKRIPFLSMYRNILEYEKVKE